MNNIIHAADRFVARAEYGVAAIDRLNREAIEINNRINFIIHLIKSRRSKRDGHN
jgi:hypothetical protein